MLFNLIPKIVWFSLLVGLSAKFFQPWIPRPADWPLSFNLYYQVENLIALTPHYVTYVSQISLLHRQRVPNFFPICSFAFVSRSVLSQIIRIFQGVETQSQTSYQEQTWRALDQRSHRGRQRQWYAWRNALGGLVSTCVQANLRSFDFYQFWWLTNVFAVETWFRKNYAY